MGCGNDSDEFCPSSIPAGWVSNADETLNPNECDCFTNNTDCNGVCDGSAVTDECNNCCSGDTGVTCCNHTSGTCPGECIDSERGSWVCDLTGVGWGNLGHCLANCNACDCNGNYDQGCGCGVYNELPTDGCDSNCGSTAVVDECGECGGGGIPDGDCDCNGNYDQGCGCGVYDESPTARS